MASVGCRSSNLRNKVVPLRGHPTMKIRGAGISVYIMGRDIMSQDENQLKFAAAESAVAQVSDGMILGLGSGSTAEFAVRAIGKRVQRGLRIVGIPTSERTAALAQIGRAACRGRGDMS